MPIEFRCTNCEQLLRVPDDAAGKNARCPKCGALATIPSPGAAAGPVAPPPPMPPSIPPAMPPASPFGDAALPAGGNPFAADYPAKPSLNPYAPPSAGYAPPTLGVPSLPVTNQRVEVGQIWNYSWQIWQANLGLLVGVTLTVIAITYAVGIPVAILQTVLEQNDNKEGAVAVAVIGNLFSNAVQMFVGIGQAMIALKLARQQPASFGDLFAGGGRFLPVLGMMILAMLALIAGFALCIVPGIFLLIMFWPCYYLVVEEKASVFESFSLAYTVTEGNRVTTLLLWLLSIAVALLGLLAFCIGIIFAAPLITMLWATAYLMMSGQLAAWPMQAAPGYGAAAPQMPAK
jgi:phage FluMu protein Com